MIDLNLKYDVHKQRWKWDEEAILRSTAATGKAKTGKAPLLAPYLVVDVIISGVEMTTGKAVIVTMVRRDITDHHSGCKDTISDK